MPRSRISSSNTSDEQQVIGRQADEVALALGAQTHGVGARPSGRDLVRLVRPSVGETWSRRPAFVTGSDTAVPPKPSSPRYAIARGSSTALIGVGVHQVRLPDLPAWLGRGHRSHPDLQGAGAPPGVLQCEPRPGLDGLPGRGRHARARDAHVDGRGVPLHAPRLVARVAEAAGEQEQAEERCELPSQDEDSD